MADLTPDIVELRVPLPSLPGLDPVGLVVWHAVDQTFESGLCFENESRTAGRWLALNIRVRGGKGTSYFRAENGIVDLADAATRDRVARWVADRVEFEVGSTAPGWGFVDTDWGFDMRGWLMGWRRQGEPVWWPADGFLAGADPNDDRLLPDGSKFVDALALARVAVHVGSRP